MNRLLLSAAVALLSATAAFAQTAKPVTAIAAFPTALKLKGMEDAPQLLITGKQADGRDIDLSAAVTYSVSDPKVARVEPTGRVFPVANGSAEITITYDGKSVKVPLTAEKMEAPQPLNFANHVVPIFTKLSCSSGGCHGKIAGQNGFRL
ncbi:MAG: Ig-like domain-containing protein, partial [Gemmataceae bacterium]